MKVTVCELPDGWIESDDGWDGLRRYLETAGADLLVLPEMSFYPWVPRTGAVDPDRWAAAVRAHEKWIDRMDELPVPTICGTRPVLDGGRRTNEGFVWRASSGYQAVHTKYYLPDEEGFWEATWYQRGDGDFRILDIDGMKIGFLICTELWFNERARIYGKQGADLLICPRATPTASTGTWIAGGRAAAVVSGAFCLSSNRNGPNVEGIDFGGTAWIIEPESGTVLGVTAESEPYLTMDIALSAARDAKKTYPRYVPE